MQGAPDSRSLRACCPDPLLAGTTSLPGRTLCAALPPGLLTDLFTWSASCSNLPYIDQAPPFGRRASPAGGSLRSPPSTPESRRCWPSTRTYLLVYLLPRLAARLGLRAREVASVELGDVDWRHGEIVVRGKRRPVRAVVGATRCRRRRRRLSLPRPPFRRVPGDVPARVRPSAVWDPLASVARSAAPACAPACPWSGSTGCVTAPPRPSCRPAPR
jgi:hypothetical protein